MVFGADEAGRGPVCGPMVAAAVTADPEVLPEGVADSKTLAPAKREALAAETRGNDRIGVGISVVPPARIDDPETDMNGLTVMAQADAITRALGVDAGTDGDTEGAAGNGTPGEPTDVARPSGVVDACDVDPERFARRVTEAVPVPADIHATHRADETHAAVAAASVLAKVERDSLMADLDDRYREYGPTGSGYPSDPRTRKFLCEYVRANGELPACARATWKTSRDVLEAATQSSLGDF